MTDARKLNSTDYPILFLMVDSTDHVTGKTGLTPTVTISKNGAAFTSPSGAVSEIGSGWYALAGNATDRNTLGELAIHASATGADPCDMKLRVVSYDPFSDINSILEDTGTTLPASIAGVDTDVWSYTSRTLTQSAASVASAVAGSTITAMRGDTLSAALTNIGALTNYSKIWFTVKADDADTDAESLIQIENTGGLLYINGAAATTSANGSITIDDEPTGDITVVLDEAETAKLSPGSYHYDIQILRSTGIAVSTLSSGTFIVSADYTMATS